MKRARIVEGVALDVTTRYPAELYHPDLAARFVTVPDQVEDGWILAGGVWSAPEVGEQPAALHVGVQLAIIDLRRRFQPDELVRYSLKSDRARALNEADYAAAVAGDIELQMLFGMRLFLESLDALRLGVIEIDHAETIQFLQLLVALDVLASPSRVEEVLAGLPPSPA